MQDPTSLRKAALLVRSLDADSAAVLLSQLSPTEAKAVRLAMRDIHEIDPEEQAKLRDELSNRGRTPTATPTPDAGVELELSLPSGHLGASELEDPLPAMLSPHTERSDVYAPAPRLQATTKPATTSTGGSPFAWLEGGDLPRVAEVLEREHISTVAIVLSHLSPSTASQLLAALPAERRSAAVERLADLGDSDQASVEVIEKGLAEWLTSQKDEQRRRADRIGTVQAILRHSTTQTYAELMADISSRNRNLAQEIGIFPSATPTTERIANASKTQARPVATQAASLAMGASRQERSTSVWNSQSAEPNTAPSATKSAPTEQPTFDFDELVELNQSQLAELFRHCQAESIVLALAGSSEAVTKHVKKCLPRSVAKELMRRINQIRAISLTDVGRSQQQISSTANRMFGIPAKPSPAAVPQLVG